MNIIIRVQRKWAVTLPSPFRTKLGIKEGDMVEASQRGSTIVLTPKVIVNRSKVKGNKHTGRRT